MSFQAFTVHSSHSGKLKCSPHRRFTVLTYLMSFSVFLVKTKTLVHIRGIVSLVTTFLLTDSSGKTLGA